MSENESTQQPRTRVVRIYSEDMDRLEVILKRIREKVPAAGYADAIKGLLDLNEARTEGGRMREPECMTPGCPNDAARGDVYCLKCEVEGEGDGSSR